jgi:hypothetical protein
VLLDVLLSDQSRYPNASQTVPCTIPAPKPPKEAPKAATTGKKRMRSMPHQRGNTLTRKVAMPKSTKPTTAIKKPRKKRESRMGFPTLVGPIKAEAPVLADIEAIPVNAATEPAVPSRP